MKNAISSRNLPRLMWGFATLGLLTTIVAIYLYVDMFGTSRSAEHAAWAQFGDYVGGALGPVFAFLALTALLITMHLQHRELSISSEELRISSRALSEQSKSLELQNFENRYFNMLNLQHTIVNAIDLRRKNGATFRGRDCLRIFYERLQRNLRLAKGADDSSYLNEVLNRYEKFYIENGHELSHYFRHLYRILKYIENSDVADKRDYSGIMRAQLSNHELGLLFYNGLSQHGEKLKPLAEKYALFENMEVSILNRSREDVTLYRKQAFGDRAEILFGLSRSSAEGKE